MAGQGKKKAGASKSGRKSSGAKKTARNKKSASKPNNSQSSVISNDLKIITAFVVMILLELSNFSLIGKVGDVVSHFMFGIFGLFAYITPILVFIAISFFMANVSSKEAMIKLVASVIMFVAVCAFLQLVFAGTDYGLEFGKMYKECAKAKNGGGILGGIFAALLYSAIGIYGAFIVIIAILILAMVIISEKSFVNGVKAGSRHMYESAKTDYRKMKENSAERIAKREQNKMERAKNTVRGVSLNSKVTDENDSDANVHELVKNGASIYRGPIDSSEIESSEIESSETAGQQEQYVIPSYEKIIRPRKVEDVLGESERASDFESYNTENGDFKPKEKIEVSKAAKAVAGRKAFSGTSMAAGGTAVSSGVSAATTGLINNQVSEVKEISNDRAVPDVEKVSESGKTVTSRSGGTKSSEYKMPPLNLLRKGTIKKHGNVNMRGGISETALKLQETLNAFGVKASVINESRGPSVTRYELQPETGTKVSKITSLTDDIKLNLAASDIRIEAPIPGKAAVGIEVPNAERDSVFLRDLIESTELSTHPSKLAFAAGMDIAGKVIVADIAKMPHMLIAGTTGSGKSVFTNSIIMSILYRAKPTEVKMIIVDPKVVEFGVYNGIPHLLTPVVTDPKKAAGALNWAVGEMQRRYTLFADFGVRDLKGYNERIKSMNYEKDGVTYKEEPQIVIIIDELADLMMVASKEVEGAICRLAQLARAAGIHLIIATQRPSVDVVTGLIKANIPSRVALLVSSGTDSRTIIDCNGGEKLLGNGDMLFYPSGYVKPVRLQGAFVSDGEVQSVVNFLISNNMDVEYNEEVTKSEVVVQADNQAGGSVTSDEDGNDVLFDEAAKFVIEKEKASTSMLQRMFKIGFNRASRIIEQLESAGVIGQEEGTKPRKVLMTLEEFENLEK